MGTRGLLRCVATAFGALFAFDAIASIPAAERDALVAFYTATHGENWVDATGWNGPAGSECSWYGVLCDPDSAHVIQIALQHNNLYGELPDLGGLPELRYFAVADNGLFGALPPLDGEPHLVVFDVGNNYLEGPLPNLSGLPDLTIFNAYVNRIGGPLPDLSGNLQLIQFELGFNRLTGPLPSLAGLVNLQDFSVSLNELTGPIPSLAGLTRLMYFDVASNHLSGPMPDLSTNTALAIIRLDDNDLSGALTAPPANLLPGASALCPNQLHAPNPAIDAAWNVAATNPWWLSPGTGCDLVIASSFEMVP